MKRLIIHGLLHLLGFDDKTFDEKLEMEKLENQYLKTFDSLLYPELNV